jgi:large subunit ribosomal protein L25
MQFAIVARTIFFQRAEVVENFTIEISQRQETGKGECSRLRRNGFIPGVAYHRGTDSIAVAVPQRDFLTMAQKARLTQVFTFKSDTKDLDGKLALVKDIQRDHVKGTVLHVDFVTLKAGEEIHVDVPLKLIGEAPGVKTEGGILTFVTHKVSVTCLPKDIPTICEVDISGLALGESIHAKDLKFSAGVTLRDDLEETIVSVVGSRGSVAKAAATEESSEPGASDSATKAE